MGQKFPRQISAGYEVALGKDQRLPLWNGLPLKVVSAFSLECSAEDELR